MTTIDDVYTAINPLPAMLSEKGKVRPSVEFTVEANAKMTIGLKWKKPYCLNEWEHEYEWFSGDDFSKLLGEAKSYIKDLPSAEQAKLNHFMGKLGNLIDAGKDEGIDVDYLNPLLDTMKRLSENVVTYQPRA